MSSAWSRQRYRGRGYFSLSLDTLVALLPPPLFLGRWGIVWEDEVRIRIVDVSFAFANTREQLLGSLKSCYMLAHVVDFFFEEWEELCVLDDRAHRVVIEETSFGFLVFLWRHAFASSEHLVLKSILQY